MELKILNLLISDVGTRLEDGGYLYQNLMVDISIFGKISSFTCEIVLTHYHGKCAHIKSANLLL